MVLGASWSCIAPSPTRHNDHFEAILERNCVRPPNIVRKMARFNKLHCKVVFRSVSPCFLTKTIGVAGLLPVYAAVASDEARSRYQHVTVDLSPVRSQRVLGVGLHGSTGKGGQKSGQNRPCVFHGTHYASVFHGTH